MGKLKSSSEDPNETTSQVLSRIWNVVWFIVKWCFRIGFGVFFGVIAFAFALGGVRLPKFDLPRPNPRKFDPEKFRRELEEMRVEDLLKGFGKQLEEFDKNNQLNSEEKKVFGKLKGLDRYGLRSQLKEAISDDEMEILFLILLKLLTGELR
ncbi:MAG TPA: hypothetical protein DD001_04335 [Microcoleaceae bacterium UBA10368]|jgi:hypothetical protein|nr:hypothetical protein [Microcoleaceae cyanobacterium UBA10368]HCV29594.1 hypothetical protein [Microcoleaceae cyanobacterium UBA9251]